MGHPANWWPCLHSPGPFPAQCFCPQDSATQHAFFLPTSANPAQSSRPVLISLLPGSPPTFPALKDALWSLQATTYTWICVAQERHVAGTQVSLEQCLEKNKMGWVLLTPFCFIPWPTPKDKGESEEAPFPTILLGFPVLLHPHAGAPGPAVLTSASNRLWPTHSPHPALDTPVSAPRCSMVSWPQHLAASCPLMSTLISGVVSPGH